MTKTELRYIADVLAGLKPDQATAPIIQTAEWRRVVVGMADNFQHSSFAHLFNREEWIGQARAATPEPAPREGEPFELDGAWYNLTESEATARGLVADPASPRWLAPRNLDEDGNVIVDTIHRQIIDAVTGQWRPLTPSEEVQYPAPPPSDAPPLDAWEGRRPGSGPTVYCGRSNPSGMYSCTRPPGHTGNHEAVRNDGVRYCQPWANVPRAAVPADTECGCEFYGDEDPDTTTPIAYCTRRANHRGTHRGQDDDGEDVEW